MGARLDELEAVYRQHLPQLRRVATAIVGDEERGCDAVQEAFGRAIRREAATNGASPHADELRARITLLPERQRLVLFLRYHADLDYASIATALQVAPGTVAATLHAAHAALRRTLPEVPL
jgi:DNA-directed RNA polymerase specialized sigma24 family protein